jgi:hypothetical protein
VVLSGAVLSFLCFFVFLASEDDWSEVVELLPALEGVVPVVSEGFELGCGAVVWSLLLGVLGLVLGVLGLVLGVLLGCCVGCCMLPLDCATAIAPVNRIAQNSFVNFDIKNSSCYFPVRFYDAHSHDRRVAG